MDLGKTWHKFYDRNVPYEIEHPTSPLHRIIEEAANNNLRKTSLVSLGKRFSYQLLIKKAEQLSAGFIQLGIKKGDRICILLPNLAQFPVAHLAILKAGAISVPVNPLLTSWEIGKIVRLCEPKMVITLGDFYPKLEEIQRNKWIEKVIITEATDFNSLLIKTVYKIKNRSRRNIVADPNVVPMLKLIKKNNLPVNFPEVSPDDVAVLMTTGGMNGQQKLAELTHRNIASNASQIMHWVSGLRQKNDTVLGAIPFFHSFGVTLCLHFCLVSGVRLVLLPRFQVKKVLQTIRKYRISFFPGVPAMFSAMLDYPGISKAHLNSLKFCLSGGDELPNDLQTRFEQVTGIKVIDSYGLTEASPAAISNPLAGIRKPGSIGIPLPSTLAMIINPETGEPVTSGTSGELVIKGPQVMKSYWNNPDETALVVKNGWLFTGDRARMDKDNFIFLEGRYKNLVITRGFNVFPSEVEEVLQRHPGVEKVLVTGKKEKKYGEIVISFIVPVKDYALKEKELKDFCRKFLAGYKVPCRFEFVPELPSEKIPVFNQHKNSECNQQLF